MSESLHLVTPYDADADPLTVEIVRDHLRVSDSVEDMSLRTLGAVSLRMAQRLTQRRILPETWRADLCGFWSGTWKPPYPPLVAVESIQYYDSSNVLQTLATTVYDVIAPYGHEAERGSICLADGQSWPDTYVRPDAVQVTFRCGYASGSPESVDVPEELTHARLLMITDLYEHRGSGTVGTGTSVTPNIITAEKICFGYRDLTAAG